MLRAEPVHVGEQEAVLALVGRGRDRVRRRHGPARFDEGRQIEEELRPGGEDDRRVDAVRPLPIGQVLDTGAVGKADVRGRPDLDARVRVDVNGLADQVCTINVLFDHHIFSVSCPWRAGTEPFTTKAQSHQAHRES